MARVNLVPASELTPAIQCYIGQTADGVLRGLDGHQPKLAEPWLALYLPLCREDGALPIEFPTISLGEVYVAVGEADVGLGDAERMVDRP